MPKGSIDRAFIVGFLRPRSDPTILRCKPQDVTIAMLATALFMPTAGTIVYPHRPPVPSASPFPSQQHVETGRIHCLPKCAPVTGRQVGCFAILGESEKHASLNWTI